MQDSDININIRTSVDNIAFRQQAIAQAESERIARAALRAQIRADIQREIAELSAQSPHPGDNIPNFIPVIYNAPKALAETIAPGFWDKQAKKLSIAISDGADAISQKFQQLTGANGTPIVDSFSLKPSPSITQQLQNLNATLQTIADAEAQDSTPITNFSQVPPQIIEELRNELAGPTRSYAINPDYNRKKRDYNRMRGTATPRQIKRSFTTHEIEQFEDHDRRIRANPGTDPLSLSPYADPAPVHPDRDRYQEQRAEYESMLSSGYSLEELTEIFGRSLIEQFEADAAPSSTNYEDKRAEYESMRSSGYTPEELSEIFGKSLIKSFERDAAQQQSKPAPPATDKRTDDLLREAQQLADRIAKGEALDGRSAEQLLALWQQAQATKDKKDDAFVAQLIQLMQTQADIGARLQAEVRTLKRKTDKLTNRNFD